MKCLATTIISVVLAATQTGVAEAGAPTHAPTPSAAPAFDSHASGPPVSDDLLAGVRGMADVQAIDQVATVQSTGTVEANTINGDVATGAIAISDTALNNVNGLALFNLNTGNNVSINSTMTVNVAIQQ